MPGPNRGKTLVRRSWPSNRPVSTVSMLVSLGWSSSGTIWAIASRKARASTWPEATARAVGGTRASVGSTRRASPAQ